MISCANIQKSDLPPEETKIDIKQVTSVEWFQGRKEPSCAEETQQHLGDLSMMTLELDHNLQQYKFGYSRIEMKDGCTDIHNIDCYQGGFVTEYFIDSELIKMLEAILNEIPSADENIMAQSFPCMIETLNIHPQTISDGFVYCEGCNAGGAAHAQKVGELFNYLNTLVHVS